MLSWLWNRRARNAKPPEDRGSGARERVQVGATAITVLHPDGKLDTLAWADLGTVTVLTSDAGPAETDLFWVLQSRDGRHRLVVPMGATGEHDLVIAMQARLNGFDNMAVIEAMGSTGHASFRIWEHAKRQPHASY